MIDIDHPAIQVGVGALFGHHPERGGPERAQAVFSVLNAVIEAGYLVEPFETSETESLVKNKIKDVLRRYQNSTLDYEVGHRLLGDLLAAIGPERGWR